MSFLQCFNHKIEKPNTDGQINFVFYPPMKNLQIESWGLYFLKLLNMCAYTYSFE